MMEYSGCKISVVDTTGMFTAIVRGKRVTAPSLAALKKKIDALEDFKPFIAYVSNGRWGVHNEYLEVEVVGRKATSYGKGREWVLKTGRHCMEVFAHTDQNLHNLHALNKIKMRHEKEKLEMRERQAAEVEAMEKKLVVLNAGDQNDAASSGE